MARRADIWPRSQRAERDRRARAWRHARQTLAAYDNNLRAIVLTLWRECPYPADPSYLLDLLRSIDTGKIDPAKPPWKYHKPLTPRITPNPLSFEEAFHQIGQHNAGRHPQTNSAEEFIFLGTSAAA